MLDSSKINKLECPTDKIQNKENMQYKHLIVKSICINSNKHAEDAHD